MENEKNSKLFSDISSGFSDQLFSLLKSSGYIQVANAADSQWESLKNSSNPVIKQLAEDKSKKEPLGLWEIARGQCYSQGMTVVNDNSANTKAMLVAKGCLSNQCIINFTNNHKQDGENNFFVKGSSDVCSGNVIMSDLQNLLDPEGHSDGSQPITGKPIVNEDRRPKDNPENNQAKIEPQDEPTNQTGIR